jgi:hypothetical protein
MELLPAFRWEPSVRGLRLGTGRDAVESDRSEQDISIIHAGEAVQKGILESEWSGATTARARGGLGLIATILREEYGMCGNPNVGQA